MFPHLPTHLTAFLRSPRNLTVLGFSIAAVASLISYFLTRKRLTEAEREHARRNLLALHGRITDGSVIDTRWIATRTEAGVNIASSTPSMLLYRYQIAGVTYECAQDVTHLPDYVRHVRVDLPIQVRFDPRNPANSIVVAESWNGLRLATPAAPARPHADLDLESESHPESQPR